MPTLIIASVEPLAQSLMSGKQAALLLILVTAIVMSLISLRRRQRESGPSPRAYAREQLNRLKEQKSIESDLNSILLHLQQFSREMNANLDAKLARIERALKDADHRVESLERLIAQSEGKPALDVTVGDSQASTSTPTRRFRATSHDQIHTLADQGLNPRDIATQLGRSLGEVELVVAMHNARKSRSAPAVV